MLEFYIPCSNRWSNQKWWINVLKPISDVLQVLLLTNGSGGCHWQSCGTTQIFIYRCNALLLRHYMALSHPWGLHEHWRILTMWLCRVLYMKDNNSLSWWNRTWQGHRQEWSIQQILKGLHVPSRWEKWCCFGCSHMLNYLWLIGPVPS
jgi:hypothetical protein